MFHFVRLWKGDHMETHPEIIEYRPMYSVEEAAKVLKINIDVLRNELIPTGKIKVVKPYPKAGLKIKGVDLISFINNLEHYEPPKPEKVVPIQTDTLNAMYAD